jgi:hypothetical protein
VKTTRDWSDWLLIGEALVIGRQEAIDKAKNNQGRLYNETFHNWIQHAGFADLDKGDRGKLLNIMDDLDNVEAWRATLEQSERLRLNHPSAVWRRLKCKDRPSPWRSSQPSAQDEARENKRTLSKALKQRNAGSKADVLRQANKATRLGSDLLKEWSELFPLEDCGGYRFNLRPLRSAIEEVIAAWRQFQDYLADLERRQSDLGDEAA